MVTQNPEAEEKGDSSGEFEKTRFLEHTHTAYIPLGFAGAFLKCGTHRTGNTNEDPRRCWVQSGEDGGLEIQDPGTQRAMPNLRFAGLKQRFYTHLCEGSRLVGRGGVVGDRVGLLERLVGAAAWQS